MPFYISNSDSSVNIVIPDGEIDTTSYSLSLIGRNVADYGQYFAENTILQLENFASIAAPDPENLLTGQQWFDKGDNIMRVWDGTQWKAQTGITVENTFPESGQGAGDSDGGTITPPSTGSGFFNQEDLKLYVWDGTQYQPAAYGGEFSSQYSNDTSLGTPSRYGTKVRNLFLESTEGPKAVLALVYNNDSDVGSVNQGTTETKYGKETIMAIFSDHSSFTIRNAASNTENEDINYFPELTGVGGICSENGGRILPGINLRQYGQESSEGDIAEVPRSTRSTWSDGSGALVDPLYEDQWVEGQRSLVPSDAYVEIFDIVRNDDDIIPALDRAYTVGRQDTWYAGIYVETVTTDLVRPDPNGSGIITIDGNVSFTGGTIGFNNVTANDLSVSGILTTQALTTGSTGTGGTVEGQWSLGSGSYFEATYADLAENFRPDSEYDAGTVVKLGGTEEITVCDQPMCTDVFGVISENPAYVMNAGGGLPVALQGRTPVKLIGSVKKGQRLVSAGQAGYAMALKEDKYYDPRTIIGRSLEDTDGPTVMTVIGVK
jgi:hypothetical protein